ncbi:BA14K family protein [Bradyrhizobium sp. CB1717]|uniref:BA14K family protein n=1 Tax=Bradyrhizobium sp. CB1717 TaxID=3039154 RepID=UPI0024B27A83|nr:BA14K family protein [Bradyrhizobium sp. CB1717]WFU23679.1 BA14K family protein [Bradyrhizobium sp. CB1717]
MTRRRTFIVVAAAGAMLSSAASSTIAAPLMPTATTGPGPSVQQIQYRHWHGPYRHHHWHGPRYYGNGAAVLGGLAAGAIVGSAIANSQARANADAYCAQRYRSYDPGSGTYLGYDGERHPCP